MRGEGRQLERGETIGEKGDSWREGEKLKRVDERRRNEVDRKRGISDYTHPASCASWALIMDSKLFA